MAVGDYIYQATGWAIVLLVVYILAAPLRRPRYVASRKTNGPTRFLFKFTFIMKLYRRVKKFFDAAKRRKQLVQKIMARKLAQIPSDFAGAERKPARARLSAPEDEYVSSGSGAQSKGVAKKRRKAKHLSPSSELCGAKDDASRERVGGTARHVLIGKKASKLRPALIIERSMPTEKKFEDDECSDETSPLSQARLSCHIAVSSALLLGEETNNTGLNTQSQVLVANADRTKANNTGLGIHQSQGCDVPAAKAENPTYANPSVAQSKGPATQPAQSADSAETETGCAQPKGLDTPRKLAKAAKNSGNITPPPVDTKESNLKAITLEVVCPSHKIFDSQVLPNSAPEHINADDSLITDESAPLLKPPALLLKKRSVPSALTSATCSVESACDFSLTSPSCVADELFASPLALDGIDSGVNAYGTDIYSSKPQTAHQETPSLFGLTSTNYPIASAQVESPSHLLKPTEDPIVPLLPRTGTNQSRNALLSANCPGSLSLDALIGAQSPTELSPSQYAYDASPYPLTTHYGYDTYGGTFLEDPMDAYYLYSTEFEMPFSYDVTEDPASQYAYCSLSPFGSAASQKFAYSPASYTSCAEYVPSPLYSQRDHTVDAGPGISARSRQFTRERQSTREKQSRSNLLPLSTRDKQPRPNLPSSAQTTRTRSVSPPPGLQHSHATEVSPPPGLAQPEENGAQLDSKILDEDLDSIAESQDGQETLANLYKASLREFFAGANEEPVSTLSVPIDPLSKEQKQPTWSLGAEKHFDGQCQPCGFYYKKMCRNGSLCIYCHMCPRTELKRRKKDKISGLKPRHGGIDSRLGAVHRRVPPQ